MSICLIVFIKGVGQSLIKKVHILGASGSGTTTLAQALSKELKYKYFDTDDFFWIKTNPPYQQKRQVEEGEEDSMMCFPEPNPNVVESLEKYVNVKALFEDLPRELKRGLEFPFEKKNMI